MKNRLFLLTTSALAMTFFIACTPQESAKTDPATLKAEIQEMENRWAAAYNAGDVEGLLVMYADDAQGMSNERPLVSGKDNLRKSISEEMATHNTDNKFTFTTLSVAGDEDMLVETGMTTITYPDGRTDEDGKYMAVWKKHGESWVCTHDMSNDNKRRGPMSYKSIHLLDLPEDLEEAQATDALTRLNAAIEGQGYPDAGYFLYKVQSEDVDTYRYFFEGVWPSKEAYEAIHASEAWQATSADMRQLKERLEAIEIHRKVQLVK